MKWIWIVALLVLAAPVLAARSGHIAALSVIDENASIGSVADIYLEIKPGHGAVYIESLPLTKIDTQISTRLAKEAACQRSKENCENYDFFYVINVPSSVIGGPSAGGAIAVLTYALLEDLPLRNDTAMTGTIMSGGIIGPVGGVRAKVAGAASMGYKTVLVPAWDYNETGIPLEDRYEVDVVRIRSLDEAVFYFTGEQPEELRVIPPPPGYTTGMHSVSDALCEHARLLIDSMENQTNNTSYERGLEAQQRGMHYSAASLCFSASLQSRTALLSNQTLESRRIVLGQIITERDQLDEALLAHQVDNIADLEMTLIITERLNDVEEILGELNHSDPNPAQLAYAAERLETARAWYTLLGDIESKQIEVTPQQLALSCKQKIEEAQERINYLSYIYPTYTSALENSLLTAFDSAQAQEHSLCLLQASQAKAEANSLLTALYVPESELGNVITEKLAASDRHLSKQTAAGTFPILGYSYNEYSSELRDREPYSALLYAEYSLELSTLDIYFPDRRQNNFVIDSQMLLVFVTGALLGGIAGLGFSALFRTEKTHRPKSATPKRSAPGKKR